MPTTPTFPPPGFRRFWAGEAVSGFGGYVTLLALQTLVVVDMGGGAAQVGWLSAARWLPYLVLGLLVGALVDRVRRRPVMIVSDLARALLLCAVPAAWAAGALSFPVLALIVAGYGTATLINDAASMSFLPRLVPGEQLQLAHARLDGADAVAQTAGPALGGVLARLIGAPLTVLTTAVGHLVAVVAVATLKVPEAHSRPPVEGRRLPRLGRDIATGVRWVYGGSGLRMLAVSTHLWFVANAVLGVIIAPLALRELGLSPVAFGLATAAAGLGALLGASVSTRVGLRLGTGGAIIAAYSTTVVGVLVIAASLLMPTAAAAAVVLGVGQSLHGFAMGLSNSHEMSYRQTLTPDELQARTNTTMRSFNRAVIVVVSPLAGLLADRLGLGVGLLVAAAVFAVAVLVLACSPFRRVRLGRSSPAADTLRP